MKTIVPDTIPRQRCDGSRMRANTTLDDHNQPLTRDGVTSICRTCPRDTQWPCSPVILALRDLWALDGQDSMGRGLDRLVYGPGESDDRVVPCGNEEQHDAHGHFDDMDELVCCPGVGA